MSGIENTEKTEYFNCEKDIWHSLFSYELYGHLNRSNIGTKYVTVCARVCGLQLDPLDLFGKEDIFGSRGS